MCMPARALVKHHQLKEVIGIRRPGPADACTRDEHLGQVYGTSYASLVIRSTVEARCLCWGGGAETASGRIANNEATCQKTRLVHNRSNVHTLLRLSSIVPRMIRIKHKWPSTAWHGTEVPTYVWASAFVRERGRIGKEKREQYEVPMIRKGWYYVRHGQRVFAVVVDTTLMTCRYWSSSCCHLFTVMRYGKMETMDGDSVQSTLLYSRNRDSKNGSNNNTCRRF